MNRRVMWLLLRGCCLLALLVMGLASGCRTGSVYTQELDDSCNPWQNEETKGLVQSELVYGCLVVSGSKNENKRATLAVLRKKDGTLGIWNGSDFSGISLPFPDSAPSDPTRFQFVALMSLVLEKEKLSHGASPYDPQYRDAWGKLHDNTCQKLSADSYQNCLSPQSDDTFDGCWFVLEFQPDLDTDKVSLVEPPNASGDVRKVSGDTSVCALYVGLNIGPDDPSEIPVGPEFGPEPPPIEPPVGPEWGPEPRPETRLEPSPVVDAGGPDWTPPDSPKPPDVGPPEGPKPPELLPENSPAQCSANCAFQQPVGVVMNGVKNDTNAPTSGVWDVYYMAANRDASRVAVCAWNGTNMEKKPYSACSIVQPDGKGSYQDLYPPVYFGQANTKQYLIPGPDIVMFARLAESNGFDVALYQYAASGSSKQPPPLWNKAIASNYPTDSVSASFSHDLTSLLIGERGRPKFYLLTEKSGKKLTQASNTADNIKSPLINVVGEPTFPSNLLFFDTHHSISASTLAYISRRSGSSHYYLSVYSTLSTMGTKPVSCKIPTSTGTLTSMALHPKGNEVVVGFAKGKILAVQNASGNCKMTSISSVGDDIVDVQISQDGKRMLVLEDSNSVRSVELWSITLNAPGLNIYQYSRPLSRNGIWLPGKLHPILFGAPCGTILYGLTQIDFTFDSIACK